MTHLLYIDPGSGSLLFQVLLSTLLTVAVFFKKGIRFIKATLSPKRNNVNLAERDKKS